MSAAASSATSSLMRDDDEDHYTFDAFSGDPDKLPQDIQLDRLTQFVDQFTSQAYKISDALDTTFLQSWDMIEDPIGIEMEGVESANVFELCRSDNDKFDRVTTVFSELALETRRLRRLAEQDFYGPIALFGEHEEKEEGNEGLSQLMFGRMLPFFENVWHFVNRVLEVIQNLVRQLAALYSPMQELYRSTFERVQMHHAFSSLGQLLGILLTLDHLIMKNEHMKNCLNLYKRMLRTVKNDAARFSATLEDVKKFEKVLLHMEGQMFDSKMLQFATTEQEYDLPPAAIVRSNDIFRKVFLDAMQTQLGYISTRVGQPIESNVRDEYVNLCAMVVFYVHVFRDFSDKKFFKTLWDVQRRHLPVLHLYGNTAFFPAHFLRYHAPGMMQALGIKDPERNAEEGHREAIRASDGSIEARVSLFSLELDMWTVHYETSYLPQASNFDRVAKETNVLVTGVFLAHRISGFLKNMLYLHVDLAQPMTSGQVLLICRLVEMLKIIEQSFFRKSATYGQFLPVICEDISHRMQHLLLHAKGRLEGTRRSGSYQVDQLSAISLMLKALMGPPTDTRLAVARTACNIVCMSGSVVRDVEAEELLSNMRLWEITGQLWRRLRQACDTSFLYGNRALLPVYLKHIFDNTSLAHRLPYMIVAMQDSERMLLSQRHLEKREDLLMLYKKELEQDLQDIIITPLAREIENDLRLHIHTVVLGQKGQVVSAPVRDPSVFFDLRPLRVLGSVVDIKSRVSHYLNQTFYNLTAIALHDWKTYGEMRNLAREKYNLQLPEVYLPGATLEQGLDVLEITRNIHLFVSRYSYDIYNQTFVERCAATEAKHLNTINIRHISNSIRTHGTGIMNTTVNLVYQFLSRKFFIYSQFLYDDYIKSRLITDIRFFREQKESLGNMYPMKRAEKFNKDIRKLGVNNVNQSYLDQFRVLLTEIGNAMGYVRMVRSGGLHYISNAIKFVPDLEKAPHFEEQATTARLSDESVTAARNLDSVLNNLMQKFAEGSDYFKVLVEVFTDEMRKEQNLHLRNFYSIVPPLTLSFVEHMLVSKDKLTKKNKESNFCDDGFALGVAFILKLLDQNKQFDSLRWFQSVQRHYYEEEARVHEQLAGRRKQDDETQHLKLTINRIMSYRREFELLYFSFLSARIFFRA